MKQTLIQEIALAYKKDKNPVRDHICAAVTTLNMFTGSLSRIANAQKFKGMPPELSNSLLKRATMNLIVASIKFYESL